MRKLLFLFIFLNVINLVFSKNIELSFWFSSGFNAKESIEEMIHEYNSMQSGVRVNGIFQGLYEEMETKMRAAAVVGKLPDIAQEKFEYMDIFIEEGLIEPIDDVIEEGDKIDIFPEMWNAVSRDGKTYGVPFCVNTLIFFYNADAVLRAGLNPDELPSTWKEIIEIGQKFTADEDGDGKIDRYAIVFWQSGFNMYAPFLWAYGGKLFTEDGARVVLTSKAMIKTVETIRDLVYKYEIMPKNWTDFEGAQAFLTGKLTMGPFISGGLAYFETHLPWKLKVAPMPSINGRHFSVLTGLALMNFARNKMKRNAAQHFIFWLVNNENTIRMFERVGYLPVRKSAVDSLEIKSFVKENPNFGVPIDELAYSTPLPSHREYFKINRLLQNMFERVILEGSNPIEELEKTEKEINSMLE